MGGVSIKGKCLCGGGDALCVDCPCQCLHCDMVCRFAGWSLWRSLGRGDTGSCTRTYSCL